MKWTPAELAEADAGRLPMMAGRAEKWAYGDLEAGFKEAALVLDETFVTPDTSHQTLETRTAMAYWQNGKVHVYTGTQSTAQTVHGRRALGRRPIPKTSSSSASTPVAGSAARSPAPSRWSFRCCWRRRRMRR